MKKSGFPVLWGRVKGSETQAQTQIGSQTDEYIGKLKNTCKLQGRIWSLHACKMMRFYKWTPKSFYITNYTFLLFSLITNNLIINRRFSNDHVDG